MNASQLQNHFDAFYEDFWCEMCKYGEIEEVVVCDNNNDRKLPLRNCTIPFIGRLLTWLRFPRSHWERLCAVQIRRLCTASLRCAQLAVVRRPTYIL